MHNLPNILSALRIALSLTLFALRPFTLPFRLVFLLAGISDVLDGFLARRYHWESDIGAKLDTVGDLVFVAVALLRILPELSLSLWVWAALTLLVALRLWELWKRGLPPHSEVNRLCGMLLFVFLLLAKPGISELWTLPVLLCALWASLRDIKSC